MFKVLVLLLVLLGAAFYFPQTRPVVVETLAPVMDPVLTWQTRGEMSGVARELQTLSRQGNDLPTPGESFDAWMLRNFMGGSKTDAWGVNYRLRIWKDSIGIVSSGPDREIDTADDIFENVMVGKEGNRRR